MVVNSFIVTFIFCYQFDVCIARSHMQSYVQQLMFMEENRTAHEMLHKTNTILVRKQANNGKRKIQHTKTFQDSVMFTYSMQRGYLSGPNPKSVFFWANA